MAVPVPMLTDFGIHYRLDSCEGVIIKIYCMSNSCKFTPFRQAISPVFVKGGLAAVTIFDTKKGIPKYCLFYLMKKANPKKQMIKFLQNTCLQIHIYLYGNHEKLD